jgi:hypothetical protein
MMSYADQVIVSGQPTQDAIPGLLYSSVVGKHTSISYIGRAVDSKGSATLKLSQYIWEHKAHRPNTHSFPIACPLCRCVYPWRNITSYATDGGSSFELKCTTKLENGGRCAGMWKVPERPNSSVVPSEYVGTWRVM